MAGDERLRRYRLASLDEVRRTTTAADAKGGRSLVAEVVQFVQPDARLGRRLTQCGRRNPRNDSREFCERAACPKCMQRRGIWLFLDRTWPALKDVPPSRLRWVTVLMFRTADSDDGFRKMKGQHRRLQHILKKFAGGGGRDRTYPVRVWGAREVEPDGDKWLFHVHMLIDFADADPSGLAELLRGAWGSGDRQVQVKHMEPRPHRSNIYRLTLYMTKARYASMVDGKYLWWTNEQIAAVALWRDRHPSQGHRFTWGVKMPPLSKSTPHKQLQ